MLQEAAFESFLEHGYARTTVEDIASRAGVGRSTFFSYFSSKADVFWIELDDAIVTVREHLAAAPIDQDAISCAREAILAGAERLGPARVPWPLTQAQLIGADEQLRASAAGIVTQMAAMLADAIARRSVPSSRALAASAAAALLGAAVAAVAAWADAGATRGPLAPRIDDAIAPVCAGFGPVFDPAR
jgi:AcrR family transcriptional regulator